MSTSVPPVDTTSLCGADDYPVLVWLQQLQDMAETAPDEASARSLRLARAITQAVQSAYVEERERGADTTDISAAFPTALAHALVAIGGTVDTDLSLLEVVRILGSETFSSAEHLAAIAEEQLDLDTP